MYAIKDELDYFNVFRIRFYNTVSCAWCTKLEMRWSHECSFQKKLLLNAFRAIRNLVIIYSKCGTGRPEDKILNRHSSFYSIFCWLFHRFTDFYLLPRKALCGPICLIWSVEAPAFVNSASTSWKNVLRLWFETVTGCDRDKISCTVSFQERMSIKRLERGLKVLMKPDNINPLEEITLLTDEWSSVG